MCTQCVCELHVSRSQLDFKVWVPFLCHGDGWMQERHQWRITDYRWFWTGSGYTIKISHIWKSVYVAPSWNEEMVDDNNCYKNVFLTLCLEGDSHVKHKTKCKDQTWCCGHMQRILSLSIHKNCIRYVIAKWVALTGQKGAGPSEASPPLVLSYHPGTTHTSSCRFTLAWWCNNSNTRSSLPFSACLIRGVVPSPCLTLTFAPALTSWPISSLVWHENILRFCMYGNIKHDQYYAHAYTVKLVTLLLLTVPFLSEVWKHLMKT